MNVGTVGKDTERSLHLNGYEYDGDQDGLRRAVMQMHGTDGSGLLWLEQWR
jgi:hypothetical protein